MERAGHVNAYKCKECNFLHVCINLVTGVTPFGIRCKFCGKGDAYSQFYRIQQDWLTADNSLRKNARLEIRWAWYRPKSFLSGVSGVHEHLLHGGLLFDSLENAIALCHIDPKMPVDWNEGNKVQVLTMLQRLYGPPV